MLLFAENQKNSISVKTPYGKTEKFTIENTIMQGSIFGSLKCTTSMSQLGRNAYNTGAPLLTYKNTVKIPSLGMIDDILTISKCGQESIKSNSVTNSFIESKRLELSKKKCCRIHIGKRINNKKCADLKVHDKIMKESPSEKYIGIETGKNGENYALQRLCFNCLLPGVKHLNF